MGTTVSTNLALIKPDGNESIQEDLPTFAGWADQNADNCDVIDALFRTTEHTYVPVLSAVSGGFTLGAGGFVEGKYIRVFPRMVIAQVRIFAGGAGFAAGIGNYNLTIPVAVAAEFATFQGVSELPLGKAVFYDNSAALTSSIFVAIYSTAGSIFFRGPDSTIWGAATPVALGQNDRLSVYFMYPTSVA